MAHAVKTCSERSMLLLRTNYFDNDMIETCAHLSKNAGMPFAVVADETKGRVAVPEQFTKLTISNDVLAKLDLLIFNDWGWRCGDYFLICAERNFPDVDYFWMIEPDVYLKFDDIRAFFQTFDDTDGIDLIAAEYGDIGLRWPWSSSVEKVEGRNIKRCLFPVVRVSRRLIAHVHRKRIDARSRFPEEKWREAGDPRPEEWANDEAIVSNAAADDGFSGQDINRFGEFCDPQTFHLGVPFSLKFVKQVIPKNNKIFHRVLSGDRFVAKVKERFWSEVRVSDDVSATNARFSTQDILFQIVLEKGLAEIESVAQFKYEWTRRTVDDRQKKFRGEVISKIWRGAEPFADPQIRLNTVDLQGWNSQHPYLRDEIRRLNPDIVVEIGVWKGASSIFMAKNLAEASNVGLVIAVDTWLGSWDHWENDRWFGELQLEAGYPTIYRTFCANVLSEKMESRIVPLPVDSANAAHILGHYSISPKIIHLDGGHDYPAVMNDLRVWWPLLQSGGTLIGDDYFDNGDWPGVRRAFDEFFAETEHAGFEHRSGKCLVRKP